MTAGKLVGSNFYWLSTKPETLDWAKSNWWMTPTASYADYTSLAQLPKVKLNVSSRSERKGEEGSDSRCRGKSQQEPGVLSCA